MKVWKNLWSVSLIKLHNSFFCTNTWFNSFQIFWIIKTLLLKQLYLSMLTLAEPHGLVFKWVRCDYFSFKVLWNLYRVILSLGPQSTYIWLIHSVMLFSYVFSDEDIKIKNTWELFKFQLTKLKNFWAFYMKWNKYCTHLQI